MLERFYLIYNVLITLRFLTLCASVSNKKGSVLLMHGVTMKFIDYYLKKSTFLLTRYGFNFASTNFEAQQCTFRNGNVLL